MLQAAPGQSPVSRVVETGGQDPGLGVAVSQERHRVALLEAPQLGLYREYSVGKGPFDLLCYSKDWSFYDQGWETAK